MLSQIELFLLPMMTLTWLSCLCVIDEFLIQAFRVDKVTFRGEWDIAPHDVSITIKQLVGSGGMRDSYKVVIVNVPPHFPVLATDGWVAKFYRNQISGNANDLCRKVRVSFSLFKSRYGAMMNHDE